MDKRIFAGAALAALAACSAPTDNDPIYLQLQANPPSEVPLRIMQRLEDRVQACEVFNEGQPSKQYMICWHRVGRSISPSYYGPSVLRPPRPSDIDRPGGDPLWTRFPLVPVK